MNEFVIEKNVPVPDRGTRGNLAATLRAMEIGDSFTFPAAKVSSVHPTALRLKPRQFVTRTQSKGIVRIWRIA